MPLDMDDPEVKAEVDALVADGKAGLERKNAELLDELKPLKRRLAEFDGVDPAEYKKLREDASKREEDAAKKRGDFETLREQLVERHKNELDARDARIGSLQAAFEREAIEGTITRELGRAGATEEGLDLLPERLRQNVRLVEEDGAFSVRVVDGDTVQVDGEGRPKSVEALVAEAKERYPSAFSAAGGSGGGFRPGTNGANGTRLTVEQAERMSPREYAAAREKGLI